MVYNYEKGEGIGEYMSCCVIITKPRIFICINCSFFALKGEFRVWELKGGRIRVQFNVT